MSVKYMLLSDEQKNEVAYFCKKMIDMENKSRREGILALEEDIDNLYEDEVNGVSELSKKFLVTLMKLMVDGREREEIEMIGRNHMEYSADTEFQKFCLEIILTGVVSIQAGQSPYLMEQIFLSYVGFDGREDFLNRSKIELDY